MTSSIVLLLLVALLPVSIIQYPYYLYERYDDSISIYKYDQFGNLWPVADFRNLQDLVFRLRAGLPYPW